jgi:hypothetical protein
VLRPPLRALSSGDPVSWRAQHIADEFWEPGFLKEAGQQHPARTGEIAPKLRAIQLSAPKLRNLRRCEVNG